MKLLLMLIIMGLTLVMIFVGSNDAARRKDDQDKYGGDALIKAISEYNEKSNSIHGYIGSAGVTRTPLSEGVGTSNTSSRKSGQGSQMPAYMMNRPSDAQRPFNGAGNGSGFGNRQSPNSEYYPPNPYMPQTHRNNGNSNGDNGGYPPAANQGQAPAGDTGGAGDNSYYPPVAPAPQEQAPLPPQSRNNPSGKEYVIPMVLPPQNLPLDKMRLPSGQQVAFSGVNVYTFDQNGKPVAMPDGIYTLGPTKLHVRDGKKVSE